MEALTIISCVVAAVAGVEWVLTNREVRRLYRELQSNWAALQLSEQSHGLQMRELSAQHSAQLHDLAITFNAQAKTTSAAEAVDVHHAVQAGRAEPEQTIATPPPARGIKLREGLEIDFITPPTEAQMADVDEDMVIR